MSQLQQPTVPLKEALADLYATVQPHMSEVEALLQHELASEHDAVDEILRYGIRLGGKRLRPALLLLAGQATGTLSQAHVTLAAVVEMIHLATLIHDDVLDEAELRRHVDTVNARWNNETSVLLGDLLFSHAFYLASTTESAEACRTIGRATNIVCEGELRQTAAAGDVELSEAEYFAIVSAKTGELCSCCSELGASYAGADEATIQSLVSYGRNLGIAFQIADDLLDVEGCEQSTGKSLGTDLAKLKMTLPLIHARDSLEGDERIQFLSLLKGRPSSNRQVASWLGECGSLAFAHEQAQRYADHALDCLVNLPASPAKDSLTTMAAFAAIRNG